MARNVPLEVASILNRDYEKMVDDTARAFGCVLHTAGYASAHTGTGSNSCYSGESGTYAGAAGQAPFCVD